MKILVIGDVESTHIRCFVEEIAEEDYHITLLHQGGKVCLEQLDAYKQRHVRIICPDQVSKMPIGVMEYVEYIRKEGKFDICHIHYLNDVLCLAVALCVEQFQCIVANFWGSDLLRASARSWKTKHFLLDVADCILADADVVFNKLDEIYDNKYHNIAQSIRFKSMVTEKLVKKNEKKTCHSKQKIIVVCGYNGYPAQQHLLMIDAIGKCDIAIQKRLKVIFPMTYGGDEQYQNKIEEILEAQEFESEVMREYLTDEELIHIRGNTDIFIHMQTSDAFASSMLENLLCNNIVIKGSWLEYPELERYHLKCYEASGSEDLTSHLENMVMHLDAYKQEVRHNRQAAIEYWENGLKKRWKDIYEECLAKVVEKKQNREEVLEYCLNYTGHQTKRAIADEVCSNMLCRKEHNLLGVFEKNKIHKAVIYGMGKWGQKFYQVLMEELRETKYNLQLFYYDTRELDIPEITRINLGELKEVDKVIITPIYDYSAIIQKIKGYVELERCMGLSDFIGE